MTHTFKLTLALALTITALAQTPAPTTSTLPANAFFAGLGFQRTGNPSTSGWAEYCHALAQVPLFGNKYQSYACPATDYFGNATSARADVDIVFVSTKWGEFGTKTGGGAAVSGTGVGGSWALGGWSTIHLDKVVPGAKLAVSVTWQKDDVTVAQQQPGLPAQLKALADRATFRFGFGKSW